MRHKLEWRRYSRRFIKTLAVSGYDWATREGIIVKLTSEDGRIGFGEIAPVPWFPVESLEAAERRLAGLGEYWEDTKEVADNSDFPCTSFGLRCASGWLNGFQPVHEQLHIAGLLPAGKEAVKRVEGLLDEGFSTFKWKIGVDDRESEWRWAEQIFRLIHGRGVLRLDANGGLSSEDFEGWCRFLGEFPVEFVEQPLPVGKEREAFDIGRNYSISVAFDESVCKLESLERLSQEFSDAVFVIKPSQTGDPLRLSRWVVEHPLIRRIYSSAFETCIGFSHVFHLAALDTHAAEACGFGGVALMENDGLGLASSGPLLPTNSIQPIDFQTLWNQL
ncbi:o-succinylbenzoate synthase [Rubellicoccus peritrichatus]|uniref:o-succinylbenzoate synthase n=1 Tax=Rubellicoccus peritrichatus TaxID=3080537 RepID=A0AAQ3LCY0_9BACT|nr:o-succinylbenzoate synthase [Puniceicoccus sp. CR14]WOO42159.1 o-succinylbenzoate synthase [Puniceicoccus sp. CR14]